MTSRVAAAHDRLQQAVAELRAITRTATGVELCEVLTAAEAGGRSLDRMSVDALAAAQRDGVFAERGYRSPAGALADLLRWDARRSRRYVSAAEQVVERVGLDGEVLAARLESTASGFAAGAISMRHVEVIAGLLSSAAAERIPAEKWSGAEQELAARAPDYTPGELHTWGAQLLEALDQDGPEPDDRPAPEVNELRLARHKQRPGGTIRGRFDDAEMFERVAAAVDTHARPRDTDDVRTPAERQAEGLAEVCGYALAHAPARVLPETGGRRPQLIVTIRLEDLEQRARTGMLEFAGQTSPAALRMLACDAAVIPVVLGGTGEPVDVGRATRTVPDGLRRAVTARDRGCAHPGCDRPPAWCQIHHIVEWAHHGETRIDNLVMLCATHHRLVHHSGWEVRISGGRPEFLPPGWIDPRRRPRRMPDLTRTAALDTLPAPGPPRRTADLTVLPDFDEWRRTADPAAMPGVDAPRRTAMPGMGSEEDAQPRTGYVDVPAPRRPERDPTNTVDAEDTPGLVGAGVELGPPAVRIVDFTDLDTLG